MGACSSKPKTTEFEGSTEPSKGADRSIDAIDVAQTSAGAVQETHEMIASKGEEPLVKGLLSTEEGVSHNVQAEAGAVDGEAGSSAAEKGKADAGDVQKVDVGVDAADIKEVSDKATTVDKGVGGNQEKLFEDKAVVSSDEAGIGGLGMGGASFDKKVAANEEKVQDCGSITTQDEQSSRNLQDINESPRAESPIIGVIQSVDPIHLDDVSGSVGLAMVETPAHVDSRVEIERDVSTGPNIGGNGIALTEEATDLSPGVPEEATEEKVQVLVPDDGVDEERGPKDAGEEVPLSSADAQDEIRVEDTTKSETIEDPHNDIEERTSQPQEECALEESTRETHAEVMENEGSAEVVNEPESEALKVVESLDAETVTVPIAETTLEKVMEGQDEGIVNESNVSDVQPPDLSVTEDGKAEATPDEAVAEPSAETEREEKLEEPHIEETATKEEKVESVDAGNLELSADQPKTLSGEGDLAFEDASDVPLKVESSSVESGDTPSS